MQKIRFTLQLYPYPVQKHWDVCTEETPCIILIVFEDILIRDRSQTKFTDFWPFSTPLSFWLTALLNKICQIYLMMLTFDNPVPHGCKRSFWRHFDWCHNCSPWKSQWGRYHTTFSISFWTFRVQELKWAHPL